MQAQRAAERGADADVVSARQQLAAAQQELEAAMRERDALVFLSNEVSICMMLAPCQAVIPPQPTSKITCVRPFA